MERIGLFGGSFNPPHIGHVRAAQYAMETMELDRILLIPANIAPHKESCEDDPTPEQRLAMLQIAVRGCRGMEVSDMELRRKGISYTWQTVEAVAAQYPQAERILFMGTDMFLSFRQWRETERIIRACAIAVFFRGGEAGKAAVEAEKKQLEKMGAKVYVLDNPVVKISSTDVRRMVAFHCAGEFLPAGVEDYIRGNGLYRAGENRKNLPMEKLESAVVRLLNPNRVKHVLGCRDTAVELARKWGADETDAARAGLLHDITKALPGHLQLALCRSYGMELSEFSRENPKTLHAATGAEVAKRIFGENPAVVEAIRCHTTGKPGMNLLEKIIYVADYMEPNRKYENVERMRQLAFSDIDAALVMGLEMTLEYLNEQGSVVSPESAQALAYMRAEGKE